MWRKSSELTKNLSVVVEDLVCEAVGELWEVALAVFVGPVRA